MPLIVEITDNIFQNFNHDSSVRVPSNVAVELSVRKKIAIASNKNQPGTKMLVQK